MFAKCLVWSGSDDVARQFRFDSPGRVLKRSAHAEDRPAVYAAQFALSHAYWLMTYPLAGWSMTFTGAAAAFAALAVVAALGMLGAIVYCAQGGETAFKHTPETPQRPPTFTRRAATSSHYRHQHWTCVDPGHD